MYETIQFCETFLQLFHWSRGICFWCVRY